MSVSFWIYGEIDFDGEEINMCNGNARNFLATLLNLDADDPLAGIIDPEIYCNKAESIMYVAEEMDFSKGGMDYWQGRAREFLTLCLKAKNQGKKVGYG